MLFTDPSGEYESSSRDLSAQICELERVLGEVEAKMRDSLHSRDMKKQVSEFLNTYACIVCIVLAFVTSHVIGGGGGGILKINQGGYAR